MERQLGDARGALETLKRAAKKFPEQIELVRAVCRQFLQMRQPAQAIEFASNEKLAKRKPIEAALLLADLFGTLKQDKELRRTLETLVEAHPKEARAWSALARLEQRAKNFPALETALRKSIELNPGAHKDKARLAALLNRTGQSKEAATLFGELAQITGNDLVALNNAAMLYSDDLGDPERAVAYAEKAHRIAPELPAVLDTLAWALYRRGTDEDLKRAEELLNRALKRSKSAETEYHYGAVLMKTGRTGEGKTLLKKAVSAGGDEEWRQAAEELLNEG